jgi:hypothetical protein
LAIRDASDFVLRYHPIREHCSRFGLKVVQISEVRNQCRNWG